MLFACLCFDLDIIYFLCFEPSEASSFVLESFWCLRCFILFSSLSFPKAILWDFLLFCVGRSFWLMLGTVFALFHSIFFAFATSIPISRVGVPPALELGLARTL